MRSQSLKRNRACGCDCRDQDIYEVDDGIFNPLMEIDSPCGGTTKPPCLYIARFPCNIDYRGEQITNVRLPLRAP